MDDSRRSNAASFGLAAQAYDRGRPSYPEAALDALLPPGARDVLDLGAGTGKLTRQLVARGLAVTAVEPSDGMRAQLVANLPGVPALAGRAESIPLPDSSCDAVLVAQAWHWVDPALALPEVARVLRTGGYLGLLWNTRDESEPWVAELGSLIRAVSDGPTDLGVDPGHLFSPVTTLDVRWKDEMDPARLVDLVTSRSYVITASPARRDQLIAEVRRLLACHPALAGRDRFELPYVTNCFFSALL